MKYKLHQRAGRTVITSVSAAVMAALLTACGGGGNSGGSSQSAAMLKAVSSEEEFVSSMEAAYSAQQSRAEFAQSGPLPSPAAEDTATSGDAVSAGNGGNYTGTYTVELDVDEMDAVKYDGDHLYIVPSLQNRCCFVFGTTEGALAAAPESGGESPLAAIRIMATDSNSATASPVGEIPLGEGEYVQGLYLTEEQLLTVSTSDYFGSYGGAWLDVAYWAAQEVNIRAYNKTPVAASQQRWDITVEGAFVDSRRVADTLYLISRHTPDLPGLHYYPDSADQVAENGEKFAQIQAEALIPRFTVNGSPRPLFAPQDCLVTNTEADQGDVPGYPVLTSITAIPLNAPADAQTLCYNEQAAGVYMSSKAVYLTDVRYRAQGSATRVHKFALGGDKPSYRGSAEVAGYAWTGGQMDFRLSERDGLLRIVTTTFADDALDSRDHHLHILAETDGVLALETIATLPNAQRPAEIGKPNEALYGVRFFGERAYLVTFEQIDPLYVLDLSEASDPRIAGELEVTGFSDFLHPVNDNLLLGLGREGNRVKLELFDVADIAAPLSRGSLLIGDSHQHSWSEAQYDRHAFTYQANAGPNLDRFAVPAQVSGAGQEGGYLHEEALYLFEIATTHQPAAASLTGNGRILAAPKPDDTWVGYRHRSVIDNDAVYFISGESVWSALWQDPASQTGPVGARSESEM